VRGGWNRFARVSWGRGLATLLRLWAGPALCRTVAGSEIHRVGISRWIGTRPVEPTRPQMLLFGVSGIPIGVVHAQRREAQEDHGRPAST